MWPFLEGVGLELWAVEWRPFSEVELFVEMMSRIEIQRKTGMAEEIVHPKKRAFDLKLFIDFILERETFSHISIVQMVLCSMACRENCENRLVLPHNLAYFIKRSNA